MVFDYSFYICYCLVLFFFFFLMRRRPPISTRTDTLFPYTTLFRSRFHWYLSLRCVPAVARQSGTDGLSRSPASSVHNIPAAILSLRSPRCSRRSEEHTSELQSLMRISYAVFCLKKKTKHTTYT